MSEAAVSTAAPVATPAPTPAAAPAPAPANPSALPTATTDWKASFSPELKGYIDNKGFENPAVLAESYQNLEKLRGVPADRLLTLPERADDANGWNSVYNRLGRPEKPEGYGTPPNTPESDKERVAAVQKMFHESGLTQKQAEALNTRMGEYSARIQKDAETAQQTRTKEDETNLKKEWGAAYEQNLNAGRQAAQTFGVNAEAMDKIEQALGFSATLKLFNQIGSKLGEGDFVSGSSAGGKGGIPTPEQAKAKIEEHRTGNSRLWQDYVKGEPAARDEITQLHKWMAGE